MSKKPGLTHLFFCRSQDIGQVVKLFDNDHPIHVYHLNHLPLFPKPTSTAPQSASRVCQLTGNGAGSHSGESSTSAASTSWDLHTSPNSHVQLNDGYKSVSSVTSGCNYNDRITPARESATASTPSSLNNESTYGTVRAVSPNLPAAASSALVSKSPTIEGSQLDKLTTRRSRQKKNAKNVLRESVIQSQEISGHKGDQNIDALLDWVEGNQSKQKKVPKEKKKESKPKGNEKQVLSKAASLDENSLGYGSKSGEETAGSRSKNMKDVEKKNSTNITKSSTAICSLVDSGSEKPTANNTSSTIEPSSNKIKVASTPLVNGGTPVPNTNKAAGKVTSSTSGKHAGSLKNQAESVEKIEAPKASDIAQNAKAEKFVPPRPVSELKERKASDKAEDEKLVKPDEAEGPYVLVQSKKKREKKKTQQRESENFARAHAEQARREGGRVRRSNTERRKSVGSVPGSENSECSDDDDSVRSLPAGECTPRERIPKPCSSSGGTPQTSYADIARMSKDESGKTTTPPIALLPNSVKTPAPVKAPPTAPVAVTSDFNFPALSPPTSSEKTVPSVGAAVWPCRPRFDSDGLLKENKPTPSSKSEEVLSKESASPVVLPSQQSSSHLVSQKCSSKSLVDSKECSSLNKNTIDKVKEANSTSTSETLIPPVEEGLQNSGVNNNNNNTNPRVSSYVEFGQTVPLPPGAKVPVTKNERKTKDRSAKVSIEESLNKANLIKGTDANDAIIHQPTEPVVFCGGKFDTSQLPVGKKSGFEFGFFEVIETLNDNNNKITSVSVEAPATQLTKDVAHDAKQANRSQGGKEGRDNEKVVLEKDQVTQVAPEKLNKNKSDKLANRESTTSLIGELQSSPNVSAWQIPADQQLQTVNPTVAKPAIVTEAVQPTKVPSPNTLETNEKIALAPQPVENKKSKSKDVDIAQLFKPLPICTKIPDTVLQAGDYMNAYANRLESLSKEGKLTYHKL